MLESLVWSFASIFDCLDSQGSLLADVVGNFGEIALVRRNRGEIVRLADQIKRAQSFPHLIDGGINVGDFRSE